MSDAAEGDSKYMKDYDEYDIEKDKYVHSHNSGKGRSKKEATLNTNHNEPGGHTRKNVQKLVNNAHNNAKK